MTTIPVRPAVGALLLAMALAACDEAPESAPVEPVRAIKYMTLAAGADAQIRRISGVVEATTTADVAFQTGGQVVLLAKNAGDRVKEGETLA